MTGEKQYDNFSEIDNYFVGCNHSFFPLLRKFTVFQSKMQIISKDRLRESLHDCNIIKVNWLRLCVLLKLHLPRETLHCSLNFHYCYCSKLSLSISECYSLDRMRKFSVLFKIATSCSKHLPVQSQQQKHLKKGMKYAQTLI